MAMRNLAATGARDTSQKLIVQLVFVPTDGIRLPFSGSGYFGT
jgi:hypothetical protein